MLCGVNPRGWQITRCMPCIVCIDGKADERRPTLCATSGAFHAARFWTHRKYSANREGLAAAT